MKATSILEGTVYRGSISAPRRAVATRAAYVDAPADQHASDNSRGARRSRSRHAPVVTARPSTSSQKPSRKGPRRHTLKRARGQPPRVTGRRLLELRALQSLRLIFASARWHDAQVRRSVRISGSQLWALSEIAQGLGMGVNELAQRMAVHQTTASSLAKALVEHGLVRRTRDGDDRRFVHLYVTANGRGRLRRAPGPHPGLLVDALRHLEPHLLHRLRRTLEALVRVMQRTAGKAAGEPLLGE